MKFTTTTLLIIFLTLCIFKTLGYPVPIPHGGRNSVHGWLYLPLDQPVPNSNEPVYAYWSHHTPEFPFTSPHNFQIILLASITPLSTGDNITYPITMPYPPADELVLNEFTFTPPPPFSLNDLLSGSLKSLLGVMYNGSFDTSYEREAYSIATMDIIQLTTAVYLNDSSEIAPYPYQRYYSYPRIPYQSLPPTDGGIHHFYMAHVIHSAPDFDQIIHVTIDVDSCTGGDSSNIVNEIFTPSTVWEFTGINNDVDNRISPSTSPSSIKATLQSTGSTCLVQVLEEIHCVLGPNFFQIFWEQFRIPPSSIPQSVKNLNIELFRIGVGDDKLDKIIQIGSIPYLILWKN
eukprot:gene3561-4437_t